MRTKEYYLDIAKSVAKASKCKRRKFGAIIVKDDIIISTGYNGTARETLNCGVDIPCLKDIHNEPTMKSFNFCPAIHAEMNVIVNAGRQACVGATLYLSEVNDDCEEPCFLCRRFMLQVGLREAWYFDKYTGHISVSSRHSWKVAENQWMEEKRNV